MKSFKIRFNLGRGKNFLKWKVESPTGQVEYLDPVETQLVMQDCTLKNHSKTAQKIYNGQNKTVCAWVLCKKLEIRRVNFKQADLKGERVSYNPRVSPHWILGGSNVDGAKINQITSVDRGLWVTG